jgi:uncharacterized protein (DUF983 family)
MMSEVASQSPHVSAVKAVFTGRCPVCREGALFSGPWHQLDFLATNKNCPVCDTQFEPEPGFFYGALYVSYSFNVATLVAVSLFLYVLFDPASPWVYIGATVGTTIVTIPFTARMSRMLWIYLFGPFSYDPSRRQAVGK